MEEWPTSGATTSKHWERGEAPKTALWRWKDANMKRPRLKWESEEVYARHGVELAAYDAAERSTTQSKRGAPERVVDLVSDLVYDAVNATATLPPLPLRVERAILACLDWREMSFVVAAGALVAVASVVTARALLLRYDFTVPLAAANQHPKDHRGARHHFGAIGNWSCVADKTATLFFDSNCTTVDRWVAFLRDPEASVGAWRAARAASRACAVESLRVEHAQWAKARVEAEALHAQRLKRNGSTPGLSWRDFWRGSVLEMHEQLRQVEESVGASIRVFAAAAEASADAAPSASRAARDERSRRVPKNVALAGVLEGLCVGAYNHGSLEGSVFVLDDGWERPNDSFTVQPPGRLNVGDVRYKASDFGSSQNETAVIISLPVADRVRSRDASRVVFVAREVESEGDEGDMSTGSTGVEVYAVLRAPAYEAVLEIAERASALEPRRHLGTLSAPLLRRVLAYAGDQRDGCRHDDDDDDDDDEAESSARGALGPLEFAPLVRYAFGHNEASEGFDCQSMQTATADVARRVSTALHVDVSHFGAVVRLVMLLCNVRGRGVAHWQALEQVHAATLVAASLDEPSQRLYEYEAAYLLSAGYNKYNTGDLRYANNEPVPHFDPSAVAGGGAVAAFPHLHRPAKLLQTQKCFATNWSPCAVDHQLRLALARRLAAPEATATLPRLVSALHGLKTSVEVRVDLLESHESLCGRNPRAAQVDAAETKLLKIQDECCYDDDDDDDDLRRDYFWDKHAARRADY